MTAVLPEWVTVTDASVLSCPWCRRAVPVMIREGRRIDSHQRCEPCEEEFRVRSATLRVKVAAYLAGEDAA